jgi:glycosyltransferase involved in cell wall biosynthesis
VQTYTRLAAEAAAEGAEIVFLTPNHFNTLPCPGYSEIRLAIPDRARAAAIIEESRADYIHIATEGPIGWMARRYCLREGRPFTTSYHTKFPEYAAALLSIPSAWAYAPVTRFHRPSAGIMVATPSLARDLAARGFGHLMSWTRGVDTELFRPRDIHLFGSGEPVFLYAGRVSKEKNIEAFLDADLPGVKVVVGDGPHLPYLRRRFPGAVFTGLKTGEALAQCYASADVFVFPSRTDTFGLVLLEALASGLPVAAHPVTGPIDIVVPGKSGVLDKDIGRAARAALELDSANARARALDFTWRRTAQLFIGNVRQANAQAAAGFHPLKAATPAGDGGNISKRILAGEPIK